MLITNTSCSTIKLIKVYFFFLIGFCLMSSHSYASGNHGGNHGGGAPPSKSYTKSPRRIEIEENLFELRGIARKGMLRALEAYGELHSAFYEYNPLAIEEKSKKLSLLLRNNPNTYMVKELKNQGVLSSLEAMKAGAKKSIHNNLLDSVSIKINELVLSQENIGDIYGLYYCPMINKHWLQNTQIMSTVHNPYAPKMRQCGSRK